MKIGWKVAIIILGVVELVSLAFSITSLTQHCPRNDLDLGFDYIGAIVGVLAALVTMLVGWNIYTFIDTKDTIRKSIDIDSKIRRAVNETEINWSTDIAAMSRLFTMNSDFTPTQRIATNLIVFNNSRENAVIPRSFARENIYNLVNFIFEHNQELYNTIAISIVQNKEITRNMVVNFYNDFLKMNESEQNKYLGVRRLLTDILSTFEESK